MRRTGWDNPSRTRDRTQCAINCSHYGPARGKGEWHHGVRAGHTNIPPPTTDAFAVPRYRPRSEARGESANYEYGEEHLMTVGSHSAGCGAGCESCISGWPQVKQEILAAWPVCRTLVCRQPIDLSKVTCTPTVTRSKKKAQSVCGHATQLTCVVPK